MAKADLNMPFGKYELLDRIAVGGMAEIFKARTKGVGGFEKYLAIKRILPHLSENKEFIDMLVNEAKIAVMLSHANIVQVYDLGKIDDSYFIAMEYVEGKDLRAVMQRCEQIGMPLFVQHAVFIAIEMCKGLEYAHGRTDINTGAPLTIIHRDISPQNIMISFEGEVKVTDFGIAKASVSISETDAGVVKGKYEYMSPEQAGGDPIDQRTDLFSTGIVLYEMLTGIRPFRGESDLNVLEKVRMAEVEPPRKYSKSIPDTLEKIVLTALARDPAKRFPSATALKDALTKFFYSSTFNFTTSNLASYMKSIYSEEIPVDVTIDVDVSGIHSRPQISDLGSLVERAEHTNTGELPPDPAPAVDIEAEINKILSGTGEISLSELGLVGGKDLSWEPDGSAKPSNTNGGFGDPTAKESFKVHDLDLEASAEAKLPQGTEEISLPGSVLEEISAEAHFDMEDASEAETIIPGSPQAAALASELGGAIEQIRSKVSIDPAARLPSISSAPRREPSIPEIGSHDIEINTEHQATTAPISLQGLAADHVWNAAELASTDIHDAKLLATNTGASKLPGDDTNAERTRVSGWESNTSDGAGVDTGAGSTRVGAPPNGEAATPSEEFENAPTAIVPPRPPLGRSKEPLRPRVPTVIRDVSSLDASAERSDRPSSTSSAPGIHFVHPSLALALASVALLAGILLGKISALLL